MLTFDWSVIRSATSIDFTDIVDILIASILIYGVLRLLRASANRTPLLGAVIMVGVYFMARAFELFLTEMLLRTTAMALFVVFAIAFQEDIRRSVLRWQYWRPFESLDQFSDQRDDVDSLIEVAFQSAQRRIGALIVLQGRETLDSRLSGGIELSAPIKAMLLHSIFDPHSPGHDGAIVIRHGRIVRMCAHLPLSQNLREVTSRGTRHSAGLGLTELTDALVLIVSEERGVVSIADDGKLVEISSPAELKSRLERFLAEKDPVASRSKLGKGLFRHRGLKAASLATAALGWFLFARHGDTVERTFVVPIEYRNIPAGLSLDGQAPAEARLTLSGPEPAFAILAPGDLKVRIELEGYGAGVVNAHLTEADCVHPSDLHVYRIEPGMLRFRLVPSRTHSSGNGAVRLLVDPRST